MLQIESKIARAFGKNNRITHLLSKRQASEHNHIVHFVEIFHDSYPWKGLGIGNLMQLKGKESKMKKKERTREREVGGIKRGENREKMGGWEGEK